MRVVPARGERQSKSVDLAAQLCCCGVLRRAGISHG
jgi:hypothetical protein